MNEVPSQCQHFLTVTIPNEQDANVLKKIPEATIINQITCVTANGPATQISLSCSSRAVSSIVDLYCERDDIRKTIQIIDTQKPLDSRQGYGRTIELKMPRTIREIVDNVKTITDLKYVRLAVANNKTIDSCVKTIAVCAGSGSSVFAGIRNVDVQITGELSHHAVLDAIHRGITVILCDHTNTERGFLNVIKQRFDKIWSNNEVQLLISARDRDPLEIV